MLSPNRVSFESMRPISHMRTMHVQSLAIVVCTCELVIGGNGEEKGKAGVELQLSNHLVHALILPHTKLDKTNSKCEYS